MVLGARYEPSNVGLWVKCPTIVLQLLAKQRSHDIQYKDIWHNGRPLLCEVSYMLSNTKELFMLNVVMLSVMVPKQGILHREVSLYHWPPVWLVWNQLYDNWQFLFLFAKWTDPNQSNRRSMVHGYFPFSIPWPKHHLCLYLFKKFTKFLWMFTKQNFSFFFLSYFIFKITSTKLKFGNSKNSKNRITRLGFTKFLMIII